MVFIKIDISDGSEIERSDHGPKRKENPESRPAIPLDRSGDLQIVEIVPTPENRKSPEPWIIEEILRIINTNRAEIGRPPKRNGRLN